MSTVEPTVADPTPPATPVTDPPSLAEAVPGRALTGRPDKVDFQASSKIEMIIDGEKYVLRAPTLPEMEPFRVRLTAMQREQMAKANADVPEVYDPVYEVADWVKDAVTEFGDHAYQVPDDRTPAWMTSGGLPARIVAHWRAIPEG